MRPITFYAKRSPLPCCLIALVFLSLAFMYFSGNSGWKAIEHTKNTANSVTYSSIFNDPASRGFAGKSTDGKPHPKRVNIVILSLPRSGSSFLGDVFNHHPQVLYFFEPLHSLQRIFSGNSLFEFDFSLASYRTLASKFLDDVMFCDFSDDYFTKNMPKNDRRRSLALTSSPFCAEYGTSLFCDTISSHELERVCKYNYNVVAMKILTPRIPTGQENKQLLASCSYNEASECRLIHLVRDPRAVFYSLMSLKFFSRGWEPKREQEWFVEKICRQLESDVTLGMATRNSLGARYKLIRFEDLARHPLSAVNELFKFVGLEMMGSIKNWLYQATHSNNTAQQLRGVGESFSTSRVSEKIVSKWRRKLNSATVRMIEKYCGRVMNQLGYKFTGTSLDKQLNLNISLVD